jgi:hypothetical protein
MRMFASSGRLRNSLMLTKRVFLTNFTSTLNQRGF